MNCNLRIKEARSAMVTQEKKQDLSLPRVNCAQENHTRKLQCVCGKHLGHGLPATDSQYQNWNYNHTVMSRFHTSLPLCRGEISDKWYVKGIARGISWTKHVSSSDTVHTSAEGIWNTWLQQEGGEELKFNQLFRAWAFKLPVQIERELLSPIAPQPRRCGCWSNSRIVALGGIQRWKTKCWLFLIQKWSCLADKRKAWAADGPTDVFTNGLPQQFPRADASFHA